MRSSVRAAAATGLVSAGLLPDPGACRFPPGQASVLRNTISTSVEALTILGGDFALAGGEYRFTGTTNTELNVSKFGGSGDVGDPRGLGDVDIGWQPRLQGNTGFVDATSDIRSGPQKGGASRFKSFGIEFGMGARFWLSDSLSLAPTFTGIYGHTSNEYVPGGTSPQTNLTQASRMGLVGWSESTWTARPALNVQYLVNRVRTVITLSSDATFFHTGSFSSSNSKDFVNGDSASLVNKIDVDIPLGWHLCGHELRTGGYFSRTDLFGDVTVGLDTEHLYEAHGRVVLDFLNQLWKVQWMGVGGSYLRGANFRGWTAGADVQFRPERRPRRRAPRDEWCQG